MTDQYFNIEISESVNGGVVVNVRLAVNPHENGALCGTTSSGQGETEQDVIDRAILDCLPEGAKIHRTYRS